MFRKNKKIDVSALTLPRHIAIIMDGNGRWAQKRGLPRAAGHRAGANNFRTITRYCNTIGIEVLTVYAFSTENWKRPAEEVNALMTLFKEYLEEALIDFREENIKTRFIGDTSLFSEDLQSLIRETEELSANKTGLQLNLAMNYGSRAEIFRGIKELYKEIETGQRTIDDITEADLERHFYTANQPDPDIVIRPSGEFRLSNFLLWQSAYSELLYNDILWPDYKTSDLDKAIYEFSKRNRRFGGV